MERQTFLNKIISPLLIKGILPQILKSANGSGKAVATLKDIFYKRLVMYVRTYVDTLLSFIIRMLKRTLYPPLERALHYLMGCA